jgi:hypothetical protein
LGDDRRTATDAVFGAGDTALSGDPYDRSCNCMF